MGDSSAAHFERYADSMSTLAHLGNFGAQFMGRFMEVFVPQRVVVYGSPSPEVRGALGGWGPAFMTSLAGFRR